MISSKVFDVLRQEHPEVLGKVSVVAGDITSLGFGLSSTDLETICDEVSIIFNSAATVKFDEELKAAVKMNVEGPRQLLQICRKMKHLEVGLNDALYSRGTFELTCFRWCFRL